MRVFWILVVVIVLLAAVVLGLPFMNSQRKLAEAQAAEAKRLAYAAQLEARNKADVEKVRSDAKKSEEALPQGSVKPAPEAPKFEAPKAESKISEAPKIEAPKPEVKTESKPALKDEPKKADEDIADAVKQALGGDPNVVKTEETDKKEMPKLETLADGSQKVDDKYIIKGKGTKADPYVISWDQLVSIQETFDPSQKKDKIPPRISFMDGSYVKVTGYACFPLYVPQPKELLLMLNQWDGCCIGVPPTAYDALEVQLKSKVTEDERFATHGTVVGKFQVKPYVTGNWLVGLYLMTDAQFEPSQNAGGN